MQKRDIKLVNIFLFIISSLVIAYLIIGIEERTLGEVFKGLLGILFIQDLRTYITGLEVKE